MVSSSGLIKAIHFQKEDLVQGKMKCIYSPPCSQLAHNIFILSIRSFRAEWCEKYPWLHYNIELDAAFCFICMKASEQGKFLTSSRREQAFISKGFTYWKEATSAFRKHQACDCHHEANEAIIVLPKQILGDVGEILSEENKAEKAMNRKAFLTILQNLAFLARQGLPLRGGQGDMESNFTQLLYL